MKIIILGAGQVGVSVAESLVSEANDITVIDQDGERLANLQERLDLRVVTGNAASPSILDRAVASDVLLTLVMCALGADMVIHHHTRTLSVLLIIAAVGVFGSIAIARFVARRDSTR